jgi:hypothetical protein
MALTNDLRQLLKNHFPGAQVKLTSFRPGDRVGGTLIWDGFDSQPQIDRQTLLRKVIDALPPDQQLKVSFIMTVTPEEFTTLSVP